MFLEETHHIWVGLGHVFQVSRIYGHSGLVESLLSVEVDLASEAVVFVLTSEANVFESLKDDCDTLGGLGEHGLQGDSNSEMTSLPEGLHIGTDVQQLLDYFAEVGELAGGLADAEFDPLTNLKERSIAHLLLVVQNLFWGPEQVWWGVGYGTGEG